MQVIHAFEEASDAGRAAHLEFWFGRTHVVDELDQDLERPIVCFCGGRLEPMAWRNGEVIVSAVWHRSQYMWGDV
jgi:hypothetical protein